MIFEHLICQLKFFKQSFSVHVAANPCLATSLQASLPKSCSDIATFHSHEKTHSLIIQLITHFWRFGNTLKSILNIVYLGKTSDVIFPVQKARPLFLICSCIDTTLKFTIIYNFTKRNNLFSLQ